MNMIRVYIVDDHTVLIEGIYSLLQYERNIQMAGYATSAANCLDFFSRNTADVILMDISLPDLDGVELCRQVRRNWPGVMVLALSTFNQGTYIRKMMEAGASGYLLKNAGKQEIISAITQVVKGKTYFSFDAGQALKSTAYLKDSIPPLTRREREVLSLIAEGLTNSQIAAKLFISIDTVDSHRKNLHTKLNVRNTAQLIRCALESNLI